MGRFLQAWTWLAVVGATAAPLVELSRFAPQPAPARVAGVWVAGGTLEFALHGVLVAKLHPPHGVRPSA